MAACGGALVRDRSKQKTRLFDFLCPAPKGLKKFNYPDLKRLATLVGLPGIVRGLYEMHKEFGKLKWNELFNDAIELITTGFIVSFFYINILE